MISLHAMNGTANDRRLVQDVFRGAPDYLRMIDQQDALHLAGQETFQALPDGKGYSDKFVFRIDLNSECIGVADVIRRYPDSSTAFLGLLLIKDRFQKKGHGRQAYQVIEKQISNWNGITKIRLAVLKSNSQVIDFWKALGFQELNIRKDDAVIFEKAITNLCKKQEMIVSLNGWVPKFDPLQNLDHGFVLRKLHSSDAVSLGRLLTVSFRNSVNDEGDSDFQYQSEVDEMMKGKWGPWKDECSFGIFVGSQCVSATCVIVHEGKYLVGYVLTDPAYQKKGFAKRVLLSSMKSAISLGVIEMKLNVLVQNSQAIDLYKKVGFKVSRS